jgi:5-methylcytosine-specific restriction enzyme subunit McrC
VTDPCRVLADGTVEIREWRTCFLPGRGLSVAARMAAEELRTAEGGRLLVDELHDGLRIGTRAWIGVVRLDDLEIRVVPKLAGKDHGALIDMIEFTRGLEVLARSRTGVRSLDATGAGLFDLIAFLFAEETERLIDGGLIADYLEHEDALPLVRGRILVDRQLRRRLGRYDRVYCRFDERSTDIRQNQVLGAAALICARQSRDARVRAKAQILLGVLEEVCDWSHLTRQALLDPFEYDRLTSHYRTAHELARLILGNTNVDDLLAAGRTRSFVFLINMNLLFERFVGAVLGRLFANTALVHEQRRDRSIIWDADAERRYSTVIPDIVLEPLDSSVPRVAIDAKYKLYDDRAVEVGDIMQTFLYAYAYRGDTALPSSAVLYPAGEHGSSMRRLQVRSAGGLAGAEIALCAVPIDQVLDEFRVGEGKALAALRDAMNGLVFASPAVRQRA